MHFVSLQKNILATVDGQEDLVRAFLQWSVLWITLFYAMVLTYGYWAKSFGSSEKAHENCPYWSSRHFLGIIHAIVVSSVALWCLVQLWSAPNDVKFGSSSHLATCKAESDTAFADWESVGEAIAVAGLAFTTFTFTDILISFTHGLLAVDHFVHHVAFVLAGLVIRGQCILPFNAALLLSMEVSTPFLNCLLFFRHRGDRWKPLLVICGASFFVSYVVFRLFLNTYGTGLLWSKTHGNDAFPGRVPEVQVYFLLLALTIGACVQLYWFPAVARGFGANLMALLSTGEIDDSAIEVDDESPGKVSLRSRPQSNFSSTTASTPNGPRMENGVH